MRVYCCQFDIAWEDKSVNLARLTSLLAECKPAAGSLVIAPEMFTSGFTMNVEAATEPAGGPVEQAVSALARQHGVFLQAGHVVKGVDGKSFNQSVTFTPNGSVAARYSKIHPFTLGGETANYGTGREIVTFDWSGCLVAPFICYDLRFPEIFRMAAWKCPQLYTVIASWPEARVGHWVKLLQARAIENQAYVAGVNRIGRDPKLNHTGRSIIVNQHGEILADAGGSECVVSADLDLVALGEYRRALPFLEDMRSEEVRRPG